MSPAYPKPEARAKGPVPREIAAQLLRRSRGRCEACHVAPASEKHHRKYRGRGGTHAIENLLHLCGGQGGMFGGNHSGCHGVAHSGLGQERGLSVSGSADPAEVTYRDNYGVEFRLMADGTKEQVTVVLESVPAEDIEEIVGCDRHELLHIGLASSSEARVYVLHSAMCLRIRQELGEQLTECRYSRALADGIDVEVWSPFQDRPAALAIEAGRLIPVVSVYRSNEVPS